MTGSACRLPDSNRAVRLDSATPGVYRDVVPVELPAVPAPGVDAVGVEPLLDGDRPLPLLNPVGPDPLLEGDCPLPLLNPVGFDPLLEPDVPLPGLNAVGFDPALEPVAAGAVVTGAGLFIPGPGALP
jgi:hypothetical protein